MNDQLTEWIEIDESKYNEEAKKEEGRSLVIQMNVSPYDVPHQVRGRFDSQKNLFVIEFRYIDDESVREVKLQNHVAADIGRRSGRVYSLFIDVDALGASSVALNLDHTQDIQRDATNALANMNSQLSGDRTAARASKNYNVAKKVLGDYWQNISEPLAIP